MTEAPFLEARLNYRRDGFSLQVEFTLRSQWTVLFGPSGAGKTTLLRILAGLTQPDSSFIRLGNHQLSDTSRSLALPPHQREIGFVLQQSALFPHLTARENIAFGLHNWPRPERETRIEELLSLFEIAALADRKPCQLSGGERQRIAVAQALAPRPKVLLLDEPFTGIDPIAVAEIQKIVRRLIDSGIGILITDHNVRETLGICDRAYIVNEGTILEEGTPETIAGSEKARKFYLGEGFKF